MAECAYCKTETQLYVGNVPVCLKCADDREPKPQKEDNATAHAALARCLMEATLQAESAAIEFKAITSDVPSFIPPPDGAQRIHNASLALQSARNEMMKAHHRLNDFLETGIVPEDLKRSG